MTTSRPEPIRLDDLASPAYPESAVPMRAGLGAYGATLDLSPAALMSTASGRTGLDHWGDPAFRERLEILCTALQIGRAHV